MLARKEYQRMRKNNVAPPGSARASRALSGASPESSENIQYSKRRLPHFERPCAKFAVCFTTYQRRQLSPVERDLVLESTLHAHEHRQYELYIACVMPDHVHLLFEPQVKQQDEQGRTVFWSLTEILQPIKSASAHRTQDVSSAGAPTTAREARALPNP